MAATEKEIGSVIRSLAIGSKNLQHQPIDNQLISLRDNLICQILLMAKEDDMLDYTLEQLVIQSPLTNDKLKEIVKEKYPEYENKLAKMLLLV